VHLLAVNIQGQTYVGSAGVEMNIIEL